MGETKITLNYHRIFRLVFILLIIINIILTIAQIAVDIVSLTDEINRQLLAYGGATVITSSTAVGLLMAILYGIFTVSLGINGLRKLSFKHLFAYSISLACIVLISFITAVVNLSIVHNDVVINSAIIDAYYLKFQITRSEISDYFQINLKCCGLKSSADWFGYLGRGDLIPYSCCYDPTNCNGLNDPSQIWSDNCLTQIRLHMQRTVDLAAGFLLAYSLIICISTPISFIFAFILRREKIYEKKLINSPRTPNSN